MQESEACLPPGRRGLRLQTCATGNRSGDAACAHNRFPVPFPSAYPGSFLVAALGVASSGGGGSVQGGGALTALVFTDPQPLRFHCTNLLKRTI